MLLSGKPHPARTSVVSPLTAMLSWYEKAPFCCHVWYSYSVSGEYPELLIDVPSDVKKGRFDPSLVFTGKSLTITEFECPLSYTKPGHRQFSLYPAT